MAGLSQRPDPLDPLAGYSVLSLFPRTLGVLKSAREPFDFDRDLDSLQHHLNSIALQSPKRLLDQAKAIISNSSDLLNSQIPINPASEEKNRHDIAMANGIPRNRRPGLGLKRPRFSLKPDSSQLMMNPEPRFDIDRYEDPDEFFEAYEMFENAKREIDRHNGILMDKSQHNTFRDARPRRPGTFRKSVNYKHLFDQTVISSQETSQNDIVCKPISTLQQDAIASTVQSEVAGGEIAEKKVNELLDELLSRDFEDLEGDGAVNLLQERLQIKPVNLENLSIPDMQYIQGGNLNASKKGLSKRRPALSDIQNILKRIHSKSPSKDVDVSETKVSGLSEKSPLASMSLLKRRLFKVNSSVDPFSAVNIDEAASRNSPLTKCLGIQSDDVRKNDNTSEKSKSLTIKYVREQDDIGQSKGSIESISNTSDRYGINNSNRDHFVVASGATPSYGDLEGNSGSFNMDNATLEQNLCSASAHIGNRREKGANASLHDDIEMANSTFKEANYTDKDLLDPSYDSTTKDDGAEGLSTSADAASEKQSEEHVTKSNEKSRTDMNSQKNQEEKQDSGRQGLAGCEEMETLDGALEEQIKGVREAPVNLLNAQSKLKEPSCKKRLRNELSRRQSLAAAGTSWNAGVRRSTRIRSRPLEFWKGERFLYGRVHQSLATVIGVKYVSPGKADGKPSMKVKSYVSDEYKELVELVALH